MSDTSSANSGEGRIIADFDQTNGVMDQFTGESDGTVAGESRSAAERDDDGIAGGGVLDDLHDGSADSHADSHSGDTDRTRGTAVAADKDGDPRT